MKDPKLSDFEGIIVDETHDRRVQTDLLIYLLRETVRLRPDFKLIFMSATINQTIFENYFKDFKFKVVDVGGARTYPIESIFLKESLEYTKILNKGFEILSDILEKDDPTTPGAHDIIFFITSSNEAFNMCQLLNKKMTDEKGQKCKLTCHGGVYCVEVFSGMNPEKQILAQDRDMYKQKNNYVR